MVKLSTAEAREKFASIVKKAAQDKERIILTKGGKDWAALVPMEDMRLWKTWKIASTWKKPGPRWQRPRLIPPQPFPGKGLNRNWAFNCHRVVSLINRAIKLS